MFVILFVYGVVVVLVIDYVVTSLNFMVTVSLSDSLSFSYSVSFSLLFSFTLSYFILLVLTKLCQYIA